MAIGGSSLKGMVVALLGIILFLSVASAVIWDVSNMSTALTANFTSGIAGTVAGFVGAAFVIGLIVYLFSWFQGK